MKKPRSKAPGDHRRKRVAPTSPNTEWQAKECTTRPEVDGKPSAEWQSLVVKLLGNAKKDLASYFDPTVLADTSRWCAVRSEQSPRAPARFLFTYVFPEPLRGSGIPGTEHLLDQMRALIWAYCAGCTFLRENDPHLFDAMIDLLGEWKRDSRVYDTWKSADASARGNRRDRAVDVELVQREIDSGKSRKEIAHDLGVSVSAIHTAISRHRRRPGQN